MNKVILLGRIGKDLELRHTNNGTAVASTSMATSKKIKGEQVTQWHRLIFWGPQAETVTQYVKKGDQLAVEGEIEYRSYQDKDGNNRDITEIKVVGFDFVGGKGEAGGSRESGSQGQQRSDMGNSGARNNPAPQEAPPFGDEDMFPF